MIRESRQKELLARQTSVARKVYGVVPGRDSASAGQIAGALARKGRTIDQRIVGGCLSALKEAGLVHQTPDMNFVRVRIRRDRSIKPTENPMPTEHNGTLHLPKPAGEAPPPPQGVIEIAQRIGETANALALLASQLENAALELTEETEKKLTTVRNLKDLLRGFTSEE